MKETLIIKHAVMGRIYVDTNKRPLDYQVEERDGGYRFTVTAPLDEDMKELLAMKHELNVFIFREYEDCPTVKTWFYVKDGPVEYDETSGALHVRAESKIEYRPDDFLS